VAYTETKDGVALVKAFETDEVPKALSKCFEIHAPLARTGGENRDFFHFYDGSERALRLLFVIDLARQGKQTVETIKRLNDQMYSSLLRFNQEYYGRA
jgi:hypothetical protein